MSNLQLEQLNKKLKTFKKVSLLTPPSGWIFSVRSSLGMSLAQLGKKMGVSAQSIKENDE